MKALPKIAVVWVMLALAVLLVTQMAYDGQPNSDIELFMIGSLVVLTFPAGALVAGFLSLAFWAIASCCGVTIGVSRTSLAVEWLALATSGYLQWFALLPWLVRKIRQRGSQVPN